MFAVHLDTPLAPQDAWERVTDWPQHGRFVPLTRVRVTTPGPTGVGTVFVARTAVGRLGFDDVMEVVAWDAPRFCRLEKRGRVIHGWAELSVEPHEDGARVWWREEATPARLPAFAAPVNDAAGKRLFARVLRGLLTR